MAAWMTIGRNRNVNSSQHNPVPFAEQRNEHQQSQGSALQNDGEGQRAAANTALAKTLLRIAFDKTSAQRTKNLFRDFFRDFFRLVRHHSPPGRLLRVSTALRSHAPLTALRSRLPLTTRRGRRTVRQRFAAP